MHPQVREVTAAGITIISGAGNSGPGFGTILNPADDALVVGVGGSDVRSELAHISARISAHISCAPRLYLGHVSSHRSLAGSRRGHRAARRSGKARTARAGLWSASSPRASFGGPTRAAVRCCCCCLVVVAVRLLVR